MSACPSPIPSRRFFPDSGYTTSKEYMLDAPACPSWPLGGGSAYSFNFFPWYAWWGPWTSTFVRQTIQAPVLSKVNLACITQVDDPLMKVVVQNTFQSNGACQDTCKSSYAYAVILRQNCWCSNYAPADNVNTLQCNDPCPGFPSEWCGSSSSGLYAYFQLTLSPSGTLAPSIRPSSTRQSSVSGSLTTESSSMRTFSLQPSLSFQFEASSSIWSALTVITTQRTAQASTVQPTVTVTKPALSPSPSFTV